MSSSEDDPLMPISAAELASMVNDDEGATRILQCRTVAKSGFRQEHHIRDLAPFGANGSQDGLPGEHVAPTPSELLLAALGSCIVIGVHANAVARSIPISQIELILSAEMNFGALWGTGDLDVSPIGFEDISITAHIGSDVPRTVLQALLDHVLIWSPVANSLHNPISLTATVSEA